MLTQADLQEVQIDDREERKMQEFKVVEEVRCRVADALRDHVCSQGGISLKTCSSLRLFGEHYQGGWKRN